MKTSALGAWAVTAALAVTPALAACESVPDLRYAGADAAPPADARGPTPDTSSTADADPAAADGGAPDVPDAAAVDAQLLPCGDAGPCDFATSTCCLTKLGFECIIRGTNCGGVDLQCQDTSDCPGNKICCETANDAGPKRFACATAGACAANGTPACDDADPCTTGTCTPSGVAGYGICQ